MTVTFHLPDWDELWQQTPKPCSHHFFLDDFEILCVVPTSLGQGYRRSMELHPGVWLDLSDQQFHQDWQVKIPVHDHLVQCSVYLSGCLPHVDVYPTFGGQRSYLSGSGISPAHTMRYERSQRLVAVNIHLLPEVFAEFFAGMVGATDALLKVLLKPNDWKVPFFPSVTTDMRRVAQQMLNTPFHGSTRRLYLQSKVFELLTLQLQPLLSDQRLCQPPYPDASPIRSPLFTTPRKC